MSSLPGHLTLTLAWALLAPSLGAVGSARAAVEVRGVTISTHTWNQAWAGDGVGQAMSELSALGANWVTIHPYAAIRESGAL